MLNRQMVSLKESLDAVDRRETLLETALVSYGSALTEVEDNVLANWSDRPSERDGRLRALAIQLKDFAAADLLVAAREEYQREVRECGKWMKASLAGGVDLREVLKLLAETSVIIRDGGARQETRFQTLANDLSGVARMDDIHAVRAQIAKEVQRLVIWVEEARREKESILQRFDQELAQYQQRIQIAETLAATDSLTGLGNRRDLERKAADLIAAGTSFCVILMDLNKFKYINDKFGHSIGDEVLKTFSSRLKNQLRANDHAARWGGDEFLLLFCCGLRDAMTRAQQIQSVVGGTYSLGREKSVPLEISTSMGVAERRNGETLEDVVHRADVQMYKQKAFN